MSRESGNELRDMMPAEINLPQDIEILEPEHTNLDKLDDNQLYNYLKSTDITEILKQPTLVIINDHHRATPSKRILKILAQLKVNIPEIIIATGTHQTPSEKQIKALTGGYQIQLGAKIRLHHCKQDDLEYIGTTKRGTRVIINPILNDYSQVLCINSVEPHYFAGFTGGIKSLVPGLAGLETVEKNHSWALSPLSGPTLIDTNPLHLDLWEAGSMITVKKFGIQMVNFQDEIYDIYYGNLKDAFTNAAKKSLEIYSKSISQPIDILVSIIYSPLDKSLYQAQKGIENTRQVLKKGGTLVLIANCIEGIGNDAFFKTLKKYDTPQDVLINISRETYKFGDHKVFKFASLTSESTLYLVSNLTNNQVSNVFANSLRIDELENLLREEKKNGKRIAVASDTGSLVLKLD